MKICEMINTSTGMLTGFLFTKKVSQIAVWSNIDSYYLCFMILILLNCCQLLYAGLFWSRHILLFCGTIEWIPR